MRFYRYAAVAVVVTAIVLFAMVKFADAAEQLRCAPLAEVAQDIQKNKIPPEALSKLIGDDLAVGYSNKSGRVWSLLRDDLGTANDDTPLNYESAFTRGLPDGEYAINVRCFGCAGHVPVPVSVEVRLAEGGVVWRGTVDLLKDKQERTAIRFRMAGGEVVNGSASQVFKQMKRGEG